MAGKQADIKVGVITNYDDKGLKQAETGLKGFKSSIKDADGVGGKLKAGWSSVTDSIKANAGALAVGAGAALVAFGVKAVGAFTDTAKAAIDMGAATGLSTEQASRWIAVADDMGVSADALQAGIGKIGKTLDGAQWEKYGIATRDAGGNARDVNDILLDSLDKLGKITNETERAKAGNELFGKGYANLAPLIGKSREEMVAYLGAVEKGQVITDKEAKKAEKFRLAQDQLNDALQDVTLAVGGVVAGLAPMIEQTAETVTKLADLAEKADRATESVGGLANVVLAAGNPVAAYNVITSALTEVVDESNMSLKELQQTYKDAGADAETLAIVTARWYEEHKVLNPALEETERETRRLAQSEVAVKDAIEDATEAVDENKRHNEALVRAVKSGLDDIQRKWDELTGAIDANESWANMQLDFMDLKTKGEEALTALTDGTEDARQKSLEYQIAVDQQKQSIIDYAQEVLKIPPERITNILAAVDAGDLERAELLLANLTRNRNMSITIEAKMGAGYPSSGLPRFATGGEVAGPRGAPVTAIVHGGETVRTPEQEKALGNGNGGGQTTLNLTVNAGLGTNGYEVAKVIVNNLAEYDRRNGTNIVTPAGR